MGQEEGKREGEARGTSNGIEAMEGMRMGLGGPRSKSQSLRSYAMGDTLYIANEVSTKRERTRVRDDCARYLLQKGRRARI